LRFKIEQKPDGTLEQTQPTTSQPTLKDLKLEEEVLKEGLNIKYQHLSEEVRKGIISIYGTGIKEQMADNPSRRNFNKSFGETMEEC
jgi:hypothetical protein